jgi:hypothetical protein
MSKEWAADDKQSVKRRKPELEAPVKQPPSDSQAAMLRLQQQVGNRAVQRLLAQRAGKEGFELDDDTAERINQERGGGQPLDSALQKQMGDAMGHDFSGVQVHASSESDELNQQLSAKAFTTGQDIFFRQGMYNPTSSDGRELIAHELTHVVQQGTGRVRGSGGGVTVRPAGDTFEQEADALARTATNTDVQVQRQDEDEDLQAKALQRQMPEEELQAKALQRQMPEEEEELQPKALQRQMPEEELQAKAIQRQMPEEELQAKALQRQMPEEELQAKVLQRQVEPEEEEEEEEGGELQAKAIQRQEEIPEEEP